MRLLLMGQHYAPEEVSGAVLATELASDLSLRGHKVTFVTCTPNYPHGTTFPGYKNRFYQQEILDGVRVVRVWSYISPQKTFWRRICNYVTFSACTVYGGLIAGKPEVVFSASPPLPLGLAAWLLSRIWRVPWVLRVEDLYPEAAVAAGLLRNRVVIKVLSFVERFLYRRASHIAVISEGFRENLLNKGVPAKKLSVVPPWADPNLVSPGPKENDFRREQGLSDQFVVMYTGNHGYTSALEDVIEAAELLQGDPGVQFLFIGEGVRKKELTKMAKKKRLENVRFLSFQPREAYAEVLAAADLGLVTLSPEIAHTCLPGKTFNIMSSGRPILAVAPINSELAQLVQEARCGVCVAPNQPTELAGRIIDLRDDVAGLNEMGQNSRFWLESNFSRNKSVGLFDEIFSEVILSNRVE